MSSKRSVSSIKIILILLAVISPLIFLSLNWKTDPSNKEIPLWSSSIVEIRNDLDRNADPEKRTLATEQFITAFPLAADWVKQDFGLDLDDFLQPKTSFDREIKMIKKVLTEIKDRGGKVSDLQKRLLEHPKEQSETDLLALYFETCERRRATRLKKVLKKWPSIAFAQHHNFQMSFIGYTEGLSDARHERFFKPGAKLSLLEFDGLYGKKRDLINDPNGVIRDVDVSKDGTRLLFAWKKSDRLDDYHIHEYNLNTEQTKQLTFGLGRADYEPIYLPDGDILFTSTRPEQSVPCWWTEISNLYRMNANGKYLRRLAIDQVHTLYPTLLENGRVLYTRWDYSDRGQNYPHPVFNMNPDGTAQRVYYGGNSWFPTSLLHSRAIPGIDKVMAIAAGHHTRQHGKVVVLDVSEGRDEGKGMHFVAPKREVEYERVDRAQQEGDQFRYPYPLNENEFLVSYVSEKQEAEVPKYADKAIYGLYWMDMDGNRELLYQDEEISVGRPVPLDQPLKPQIIPENVNYEQETGLYYVHDVYEGIGLKGIERGTAKKIRVVQLNYRAAGVGKSRNDGEGGASLNSGPVAIGNGSWDVKEILGDVDIHEDGSALFEVPAMKSIYLQIIDDKGRVVQTTRSWDTVRPGEKKACKGCHAKKEANFYEFKKEDTQAWTNGVQQIQPFYGPSRGFSFIKEVQPVLDAHCVSCHDGRKEGVMSLKGDMKSHGSTEKRTWSEAYLNLTHAEKKEFTHWDGYIYQGDPENEIVNWISKMSRPTEMPPYSYGSATSKMMHMLEDGHYEVNLSEEEYHKMAAWLDLLVPFVGDYREANDWTKEEMAYYDYYEHKRGLHYQEELENIKQWILANKQEEKTKASAHKENGYRNLTGQISKTSEKEWQINFENKVMVDQVELDGEAVITFSDGEVVDKNADTPALKLETPKEIEHLKIVSQTPILKIKIWGVNEAELPYHNDYSPYKSLGEK